jgi:hypothetical protein
VTGDGVSLQLDLTTKRLATVATNVGKTIRVLQLIVAIGVALIGEELMAGELSAAYHRLRLLGVGRLRVTREVGLVRVLTIFCRLLVADRNCLIFRDISQHQDDNLQPTEFN